MNARSKEAPERIGSPARSAHFQRSRSARGRTAGFTLAEVVICLAIIVLVIGSVISAYIGTCFRAQWSGYNFAAQSLAMQELELARTAKWDLNDTPPVDQITNLNLIGWSTNASGAWSGYTTNTLDLPVVGTNVIWATNYTTVSLVTLSTTPPTY